MPRRLKIVCTLFLLAPTGCGMFSQYGPAPPVAVPPTAVVLPPNGSAPIVINGPPGAAPGAVPITTLPAAAGPQVVGPTAIQQSSILVPAVDRDLMWDQLVDVVDDYFKIENEDRVKLIGNELTPGRIDTFPLTGATLLEPWHRDTVNFYERLESTLQSIRRRAFVSVTPYPQGYMVEVTVTKELEDVALPIKASAGAATFRYDTSLERDTEFSADPNRIPGDPARPNGPRAGTAGWIPLPRDTALEMEILAKIQSRLGGAITPPMGSITAQPTMLLPAGILPQPSQPQR